MSDRALTIREMIAVIQADIRRRPDLPPSQASEILVELSSLLGNCMAEELAAEMDYNRAFRDLLEQDGTQARAKVRASCTPEYERLRTAKNTITLVESMQAALKYALRVSEAELKSLPR